MLIIALKVVIVFLLVSILSMLIAAGYAREED